MINYEMDVKSVTRRDRSSIAHYRYDKTLFKDIMIRHEQYLRGDTGKSGASDEEVPWVVTAAVPLSRDILIIPQNFKY